MTVEISASSGVVASNTDAIATLAAITGPAASTGQAYHGIMANWSYNGAPATGRMQVISDLAGTPKVLLDLDITVGGPGFMPIDGFNSDVGKSLSFKIFAGGSGIVGKANISASLSDG